MNTKHTLHLGDARKMSAVLDDSVHLVVTSPPYPMVEMWDRAFAELVPGVADKLAAERGMDAFEAMHTALDAVWAECHRVLVPGGFACINMGDATRSLNGEFCLYPNHARILMGLLRIGFTPLPDILWRKPTNAPNKFMGSGMLPAGAYVTYEHEYILICRKGGKRIFSKSASEIRSRSALFWEERNLWFSDVWSDLPGKDQRLAKAGMRERSAAFPLDLPFRLVNMYSLQGDTVLDPFVGTGTTMAASVAAGRSSIGFDCVPEVGTLVADSLRRSMTEGRVRVGERLSAHAAFVARRQAASKPLKYVSQHYGVPVMTRQEVRIQLAIPHRLEQRGDSSTVTHIFAPAPDGSDPP